MTLDNSTKQVEHVLPTEHVLDLFAVPGDLQPLPGGSGNSVLAGDLVLSPGRDARISEALNPQLARLAARLDTEPGRRRRDLRIAMPIPARDGSWTVDGWGASRYEQGTTTCTEVSVIRATGALLHAQFAAAFSQWPLAAEPPRHRWDRAERIAFGRVDPDLDEYAEPHAEFARELLDRRTAATLGREQLVHADLAENVLLDAAGAPVVIDVAPYWRPVIWPDAVCVLDMVMWCGADPGAMAEWSDGVQRQAMIRAAAFRVLSDLDPDLEHYRRVLRPILSGQ